MVGELDGVLLAWAASWAWASAAWRFRRASRRRRAREGGTLRGGGIVGVVEEGLVVERGLIVEVVAGGEKSWRVVVSLLSWKEVGCEEGVCWSLGITEKSDYG